MLNMHPENLRTIPDIIHELPVTSHKVGWKI